MKTLELKDLKHYLGTGLNAMSVNTKEVRMVTWLHFTYDLETVGLNHLICDGLFIEKHIPLFLSLSALTEPLPDGSIPIVELAKMALMYQTDFEVYGFEKQYIDGEFIVAESDMSMRFIFDGKSFWMQNGYGNINVANNQLQLFEYLYQNHFWLGDQSLFETGEIIDKRSLK